MRKQKTCIHWPMTAVLTVAMVLAWIGWEFGAAAMRFRAQAEAIEAFEACTGPESCRQALAMIDAAQGGR